MPMAKYLLREAGVMVIISMKKAPLLMSMKGMSACSKIKNDSFRVRLKRFGKTLYHQTMPTKRRITVLTVFKTI